MSNKEVHKRLNYFSMFDGYLENTGKNARLKVAMLEKNIDYIDKVAETLEEAKIGFSLRNPPITGKSRSQTIAIQSKTHPILTAIHARLYKAGHKAIEPHMLTMLDAEALAIVFMADGSRFVDTRGRTDCVVYNLHVNSFSYGDCLLFKKALKDLLFLEFNVNKTGKNGQYNLRLLSACNNRFEDLVGSHVLPSFFYKLGR